MTTTTLVAAIAAEGFASHLDSDLTKLFGWYLIF